LAFSDGDFVKIEYSAWRAADNKLLSTTSETVARENGIYDSKNTYAPQLVVIGKDNTIKGVENAIRSMNLNEEKKVEIEPKDAFGERDPQLVKIVALSDFKKHDIDPYPGMRLDIDGREAIVRSVNSGRVVVDENNPLAGEKLIYDIKVVQKIDNDTEKIKALAEKHGVNAKNVSIANGKAVLELEEKEDRSAEYELDKAAIPSEVFRYMAGINTVQIIDTYTRKQNKEQKDTEQQQQQQGSKESNNESKANKTSKQ